MDFGNLKQSENVRLPEMGYRKKLEAAEEKQDENWKYRY